MLPQGIFGPSWTAVVLANLPVHDPVDPPEVSGLPKAKLGDKDEPVDLLFGGVVKDMNLDEAEEDCRALSLDHARTIPGSDIDFQYFNAPT